MQTNVKNLKVNFQSVVNKVSLLLEGINKHNPDEIILGSETWLTASTSSSEIFPPNYNAFRKDRMTRPSSGVLIACRNTITCEELDFANNCEVMVCKITLQASDNLFTIDRQTAKLLMLLNYAAYFEKYLTLAKTL